MIRVQEVKTCDVCRLLEGDLAPKPGGYCKLCDSWICNDCTWRWDRRARAFVKHRQESNFRGDPAYRTGDAEADKIIEASTEVGAN